jgi:hypothetical protein
MLKLLVRVGRSPSVAYPRRKRERDLVSARERFQALAHTRSRLMRYLSCVVSVQRLSVRAFLDEPQTTLGHAEAQAAAGDESWEQWVTEYQRGDALIVRMELRLEISDGTGEVLTASRGGFFVENHVHAPKVEQQIAELASGDLAALAAEFAERGHDLDLHELGLMYVHVELAPELRQRVQERAATD